MWLTSDDHFSVENQNELSGMKMFTKSFCHYGYAKNVKQYKRMMEVLDILKVKELMINALNKFSEFKSYFIEEGINKIKYDDKDEIIAVIKENGFPVQT